MLYVKLARRLILDPMEVKISKRYSSYSYRIFFNQTFFSECCL